MISHKERDANAFLSVSSYVIKLSNLFEVFVRLEPLMRDAYELCHMLWILATFVLLLPVAD